LQSSWEDVILAVFAPRSAKTTAVAVPAVLDAPGAVVACSNKPDLYLATAALRAAATGRRVWTFDPQRIAHAGQGWWWNPLAGRLRLDDATRLAGAFVMAVADDEHREIWGPAATELLANLLLAAHLAHGTLLDAYRWLYDESNDAPVRILRAAGHAAAADSLAGTQGLHPETRGSVYFTARAGCASLRDNDIARWVVPQPGLPEFTPERFVAGAQTLYLLSKNVAGGGAGGRADHRGPGRRRAGRGAPRRPGRPAGAAGAGRGGQHLPDRRPAAAVQPPGVALDRAGRDPPVLRPQSYAQGERVWGKAGMRELWGAATIKLIGSGADDAAFAEDISAIIGEHDVDVLSYNRGRGGGSSSTSTRRERIMPAAQVRALPKTQAVLLATGVRPALIRLLPWYEGARRAEIAAAEQQATAELVARVAGAPA